MSQLLPLLMPYPSKTDRETILTTAMSHVETHGVGELAIRNLAATLELAPNAIYRYFSNLAALKDALAEVGQERLAKLLQKAAAKKPPEDAIRSMARAYLRFGRENPHIFALTLIETPGGEALRLESWNFVVSLVARLYGETRAPEAATVLWAFLHGFADLEAAGIFGERKPLSSFEFGMRMWIDAAQGA